jgi:hypothetical protein
VDVESSNLFSRSEKETKRRRSKDWSALSFALSAVVRAVSIRDDAIRLQQSPTAGRELCGSRRGRTRSTQHRSSTETQHPAQ